ncbi:protein adenylyltransferase SelO [Dactylosporangium cerinum]
MSIVTLDSRFARDLAEMAVPWKAEDVAEPRLLALDDDLAVELGLDPAWLRGPDGVRLLVGGNVPEGAAPVAQAYAGHQFGGFVPRLGDGRALLLGELVDTEQRVRDLHLKGSGRTPFARGGDGLAAVGPMLREYVVSRAMHALHIPTTRALAVVATGRQVRRERLLPGAVLARVASSHLRVGSFQYATVTGDEGLLRRLADHAIARHHPAAAGAERPYLALFEAVVAAQARLIAQWMLAGFVHGVMNTDNMTISGETIDYGPCAFMDAYDPATVYSSIDHGGRYAYGNQPLVAEWNLARLAETLLPLIDDDQDRAVELATAALQSFRRRYDEAWSDGMRTKLGLRDHHPALVEELLTLQQTGRADHTSTYRALATAARGDDAPIRELLPGPSAAPGSHAGWRSSRTPMPWTASTRSTSRATTWSRRPCPPRSRATWHRSPAWSTP